MSDNAVHELMARWTDGVRNKDWPALREMYTPDAVLFDVVPPLSFEGAGIEDGFVEWFDWYDGPLGYERTRVVVEVAGDVAVHRSIDRVHGLLRNGAATDYWLRHTVVLHREPAGWRIAHQHASVPVLLPSGDVRDGSVVLATP